MGDFILGTGHDGQVVQPEGPKVNGNDPRYSFVASDMFALVHSIAANA